MDQYTLIKEEIDKRLKDRFNAINVPAELSEAMYYSLRNGGKRLRPVLLVLFSSLYSEPTETAFVFAEAIEMIHTYSLIHDDLPAMDDDDLRRGKPSNHKVYGEAMAILAGDGLLSLAFELMASQCISNPHAINAMVDIAIGAGVNGMVSGQVMDIMNDTDGKYDITQIDKAKTGALLKAACLAGANLAGTDAETLELISKYADELGLVFQITDDILDVVGETDKIGKPVGSDQKNNKATYVSVYGLNEAKKLANESVENALHYLDLIKGDTETIRSTTLKIIGRDC